MSEVSSYDQTNFLHKHVHHFVHFIRSHLKNNDRRQQQHQAEGGPNCTYIERVVDQVLAHAREHLYARQDIFYMVMHIRLNRSIIVRPRAIFPTRRGTAYKVDLRLLAHVSLNLHVGIISIRQGRDAIDVVPAQAIHNRLYWLQRALVKDEVTLEDMY